MTTLVATLNFHHCYNIQIVDNNSSEEVTIAPVRAINAKKVGAIAQALAQADIAATAVGSCALPEIAPLVARGIILRSQLGITCPTKHHHL